MSRSNAEALARRIVNKPPADQLRLAAEMLEQAKVPNASIEHQRQMLILAHRIVERIEGEICLTLAMMGFNATSKLRLPPKTGG